MTFVVEPGSSALDQIAAAIRDSTSRRPHADRLPVALFVEREHRRVRAYVSPAAVDVLASSGVALHEAVPEGVLESCGPPEDRPSLRLACGDSSAWVAIVSQLR